jgi:preprotein translocase subunit SecB
MASPTNGNGEPTAAPLPPQGQVQAGAQFRVVAQYSKDFSFENPNAPQSLMQQQAQPTMNIQVNVSPKQLSNTDFEVELKLDGKAETGNQVLFAFELNYAGIFHLEGIPTESVGPLLMIECPRLLFPFAREIIASAVISGGYPPLMLDPIDFVALYQQRAAQGQPQAPVQA